MRRALLHAAAAVLLGSGPAAAAAGGAVAPAVTALRWQADAEVTVVRVDLEGGPPAGVKHTRLTRPDRVVLELAAGRLRLASRPDLVVDRLLADLRAVEERGLVRITLDLWRPVPYEVVETPEGLQVVLGRGGVAVASQLPGAGPVSAQAQAPPAGSPEGAPPPEGTQEPAPSQPEGQAQAPEAPPPATQYLAEERFTLQYQNIRGNTQGSFLNQGLHYAQELDLGFTHRLDAETTFEGSFSTLLSDDFKLAPEQLLLQKFNLRLAAPTYEVQAGDVLIPLSQLTLSSPVKGVGAWKEFPVLAGLRLTGLAGTIKTRWDEFWNDEPTEALTRYVGGIRIEQKLTPDIAIGVTYFRARDDVASAPGTLTSVPDPDDPTGEATITRRTFSTPPLTNQVVSADFKARFFNIVSLDAEAARSWTDLDLTQAGGYNRDEAYSAGVGVTWEGLRASGRYLRVEPRFFSAGGFATPDQEEFNARADYDFPKWVGLGAGYVETRDNLARTKPTTTRSRTPEGRLSLHDLPYLDGLVLDLRYRVRDTEAADATVDETTTTAGVDATWRLGPVGVAANYEHQRKVDAVYPERRSRVDLVGVGVQGQLTVWGLMVAPSLRYEYNREQRIREGTEEVSGRWQAGLTVDWPEVLALALAYQHSDTDAFVPTEGLTRWGARAELKVRLFKRDDRAVILSYERRDNAYADASRSYLEEIAAAKLSFRY